MKRLSIAAIAAALLISASASAESKSNKDQASDQQQPGTAAVTKEQRQQMATLHEKMAACLRSNKDINECRQEMRQNCQEMMGAQAQGCPMWGMMGPGKGRGMGPGPGTSPGSRSTG